MRVVEKPQSCFDFGTRFGYGFSIAALGPLPNHADLFC